VAGQLLTSVVGSYPQPDWLIDRTLLKKMMAPRVRVQEVWRVPPDRLEQAQDEATLDAIRDQERAGIDIITDGEIRRESYSNKFANALDGIDRERVGEIVGRTGARIPVPIVSGPIRRREPVEVRDVKFLRANTAKTIKITLPGPFTMSQQAVNEYYKDDESLALAYAEAVNEEVHDLFAAGADVVQLDEPWLQARAEAARRYGVKAIDRALAGVRGTTALHLCFGYAALVKDKPSSGYSFLAELEESAAQQISIEAAQPKLDLSVLRALRSKTVHVGVLDLADPNVESPDVVAARIRAALDVVPPERLIVTPDCGMKYLPRDVAFGKLCSLAAGAEIVRAELRAGRA
jgi:5-methyltetrahydropteroyltriglutamate--homocysteine methyltransferase